MVETETPDPSDPRPATCRNCNDTKKVATSEGVRPCITCVPGQKCPYCGAKFVENGPCGMCGHHVMLRENGI